MSNWYKLLKYIAPTAPLGYLIDAIQGNMSHPLTDIGKFSSFVAEKTGNAMPDNVFRGLVGKYTGANQTPADVESFEREKAWQKEYAQNHWQWDVEGMEKAGLNPQMMYGGTPSSSVPSAGSPVSSGSLSDLIALATLPAQIGLLESEKEEKDASAAEKRSNTSLNEQLLAFNSDLNPLRLEAQEVSNNLGRSTVSKINAECDEIASNMRKIAAETETEATKQMYNIAAAGLADVQAQQIVELLPYSIELNKAQTEQAKALARLTALQAMYQKRLINDGFLDALISSEQNNADMNRLMARIKSGKAFTVDDNTVLAKCWNFFAEASGLSRGVQVIDYILSKVNVFAPLVSRGKSVPQTDFLGLQ